MPAAPYVILDDFLSKDFHRDLQSHVLAVSDFSRGEVMVEGASNYHPDLRSGFISFDQLDEHLDTYCSHLKAVFGQIADGLGIKPFAYDNIELKLAAHGEGDFFKPHRDTFVGKGRAASGKDRIITAVYYLHAEPRRFQGGDLLLHPFESGAITAIEPRNNRLVAFPSFAIHEVAQVQVPSHDFADSRFSITSWFRRSA